MLLQEILHLSPCPKHGIDNPHDQCKTTREFLTYQASVDTEYLLGNLASLSSLGHRVRMPSPARMDIQGRRPGGWRSTWCGRIILMIGTRHRIARLGVVRLRRDKKILHRRQ